MSKKRKTNKQKAAAPKVKTDIVKMAKEAPSSFWKNNLIPILVLFVLPFVLYWASTNFGYVLDDKIVISENNFVKKGFSGIGDIFTTDSFQGYFGEQKKILEGGRYRPLSLITFAVEHECFGLNTWVGHFLNILFYALTGLLLFRVLLILIPAIKEKKHWFYSLAFVASLLFILHPIHTEVVANIKGRDEILALLLSLASLYFSLKYLKSKNLLLLFAACLTLFLGMLAKENALTWLVVIPLTLYYFTKSKAINIGKITLGLFTTVLIYFAVRYNALGYFISSGEESTSIMNNPFYGLDFNHKFSTILYTLGIYLKLLIYPHPLTHDYYPFQIPILTFGNWKALLSLGLYLALGIYALFGIKKKSIISYGILFYLITLSIVSNIFVNVGTTMNDRFIYMPSVGFCIIMAFIISRWLPTKLDKNPASVNIIGAGLLLILILGYSVKTITRVPDWRNALTLNTAAAKYSPNSARANLFMGVALFEDYKVEESQQRKSQLLDQASNYLDRALEIYPTYNSALNMKSGTLAEYYKKDNNLDNLLNGFSEILRYRERAPFIDEYITYLVGRNVNAQRMVAFLYKVGYTMNFQSRRSYNTALYYLNYAHQIDPTNREVTQAIGQCYQQLGDSAKAAEFFGK